MAHDAGMRPVPDHLRGRAFSRSEALDAGLTDRVLAGRRFVRVHPGVYRTADTEPTLRLLVDAARMTLPPGAALSHLTNLRWRGLEIGSTTPLHFATNHPHQGVRDGIRLHRYRHSVVMEVDAGVLLTPPARTFVDCATLLGPRQLLRVGDWLVGQKLVSVAELREHARTCHLDGVRRARSVAAIVAENVASPRESDVRWWLHTAGLPEPEVNADIVDGHGRWLARGDLVYRRWKVLVEYDGWQHERDARQRQWDHLRREQLEAAGWRVIVITAEDMKNPQTVIIRVRQALSARA